MIFLIDKVVDTEFIKRKENISRIRLHIPRRTELEFYTTLSSSVVNNLQRTRVPRYFRKKNSSGDIRNK